MAAAAGLRVASARLAGWGRSWRDVAAAVRQDSSLRESSEASTSAVEHDLGALWRRPRYPGHIPISYAQRQAITIGESPFCGNWSKLLNILSLEILAAFAPPLLAPPASRLPLRWNPVHRGRHRYTAVPPRLGSTNFLCFRLASTSWSHPAACACARIFQHSHAFLTRFPPPGCRRCRWSAGEPGPSGPRGCAGVRSRTHRCPACRARPPMSALPLTFLHAWP